MSRLHQLVVVHLGLLLVVCIIDVRGMLTSQPHNLVVPKGTVFNVSCVTNSESGAAIAVAFDFNSPVACSTANGGTNPTFGPSGANECDFRFTSIDTGDATVVQCNDDQLIAQGADIIVYTVEQCNVTSDVVQGQNATLVCDMTFYKFPHPGSRFNIPTIEWSNLPNSKVSDTFTPSGYQPVARRMTTTTSVLVQGTTFPNYNCTANFIFQGAANPTYPTTYDTTQVTATICQTPALPVKSCPTVSIIPQKSQAAPGDVFYCNATGGYPTTYSQPVWSDSNGMSNQQNSQYTVPSTVSSGTVLVINCTITPSPQPTGLVCQPASLTVTVVWTTTQQVTTTPIQTTVAPTTQAATTQARTTSSNNNSTTTKSGLSTPVLITAIVVPSILGLLALALLLWACCYWWFLAATDREKDKDKGTSKSDEGFQNAFTAQPPTGDEWKWIARQNQPLVGARRPHRPVTQPLSYISPGPLVRYMKMKPLPKMQAPWAQPSGSQFLQPGLFKPRFSGQPYGF